MCLHKRCFGHVHILLPFLISFYIPWPLALLSLSSNYLHFLLLFSSSRISPFPFFFFFLLSSAAPRLPCKLLYSQWPCYTQKIASHLSLSQPLSPAYSPSTPVPHYSLDLKGGDRWHFWQWTVTYSQYLTSLSFPFVQNPFLKETCLPKPERWLFYKDKNKSFETILSIFMFIWQSIYSIFLQRGISNKIQASFSQFHRMVSVSVLQCRESESPATHLTSEALLN